MSDQTSERGANAWLFPKVAPGTTGKSAFSKWFGRYIGAHGITDSSKVFHSFRHSFVDGLRLGGVNGEINMALLGHTDPSVHDKYGAKDKAIRFQHRLAEAVASVSTWDLICRGSRTAERHEGSQGRVGWLQEAVETADPMRGLKRFAGYQEHRREGIVRQKLTDPVIRFAPLR